MAKKGLTEEEKIVYRKKCKEAVTFFSACCGPLDEDDEALQQEIRVNGEITYGTWKHTEYLLLGVPATSTLAIIQEPKETSDYDQDALKEYRRIVRRLGDIRIMYCQQESKRKKLNVN